jgi:4-oxalomesaconate hydratase
MAGQDAARILVFSAHAADFCARCGGTIARHAQLGAAVRVVVLTYGERSESGGLYAESARPSLDEAKAIRRQEAAHAADVLGAEIGFLDWGDISFEFSLDRAKQLAETIRAFRPDAVLTHYGPEPMTVDHETTWRLVLRAVQVAGAAGLESAYEPLWRPVVFLFEPTNPLTELGGFRPDLYVDISDVWPIKLEALQSYRRAQNVLLEAYTDVARHRARQARHLSSRPDIVYAEAFQRVFPWVSDRLPL